MKHKILLTLAISLLNVLYGSSQYILDLNNGKKCEKIVKPLAERSVNEDKDGFIVKYKFPLVYIVQNPEQPGTFLWKIDGFNLNDNPGEPATLLRSDLFIIPKDKKASLKIIKAEFKDYDYRLSAAKLPDWDNGEKNVLSKTEINPYTGFFPQEIISLSPIEKYRSLNTQRANLYPIQYDYTNNKVRAYSEIEYQIIFEDQPDQNDENHLVISHNDNFIPQSTLNPGNLAEYQAEDLTPQRYLILTTPTFNSAASAFGEWKRQFGFNTTFVSRNNWTPASVQSEIDNCAASNPDLYYIQIIGDQEDVPGRNLMPLSETNDTTTYSTDYYYGCLNGTYKNIPDFYVGRISAENATQANVIVNKIIDYERDPNTDAFFYKVGLNCAYFQDTLPQDNYADRLFAQTSEEVRDYLLLQGKLVSRVYYARNWVTPQYWNNTYYSYGDPIPSELLKPHFAWTGNASDINNYINCGTFYVLHRDHGDVDRWEHPQYSTSNIAGLSNSLALPVVFSMNCLTGRYDANIPCFAEEFLRKPNGGCVGIYAASAKSLSGFNDILTVGMFEAVWPAPGLNPNFQNLPGIYSHNLLPIYGTRAILNQGLNRMDNYYNHLSQYKEYTHKIFQYFGDPGMDFRVEYPTPFTGVDITRTPFGVSVSLNEDAERISFYNPMTQEVTIANGSYATYSSHMANNILVCIYSPNRIPYIDYGPGGSNYNSNSQPNQILSISGRNQIKNISLALTLEAHNPRIIISSLWGNNVLIANCDNNELGIDVSSLQPGVYVCSLEVNGLICDNKRIIITK